MENPLEKEKHERELVAIFTALSLGLVVLFRQVRDEDITNRNIAIGVTGGLIKKYSDQVDAWTNKAIPAMYKDGINYANWKMAKDGLDIIKKTNIAGLHKEALARLVDTNNLVLMQSMQGVKKNVIFNINEAFRIKAKEKLVGLIKEGNININQVRKDLKEFIKSKGFDGLKDRAGRTMNLDSYAEMSARSMHTKIHNEAVWTTAIDNGYDLVQVTSHASACELCSPWEGAILSITGATQGYDSVEQATASGLFHCNCKHDTDVISNEEAEALL